MEFKYNNKELFLGIGFKYTPDQVKEVVGEPESIEKYVYSGSNGEEFDETYSYNNGLLRVVFYYVKGKLDSLSMYVKSLVIDNIDLFSLKKGEVLNIICNISEISTQNAYKETVNLDGINAEEYEFKDIGITFWFEDEFLDEVCLFEP